MKNTEKYNGWTNHATWAVNLHITNEEGSDSYWREEAEAHSRQSMACREDSSFTWQERARFSLADALKEEITDGIYECLDEADKICNGFYMSLIRDLLSDEINWDEIAKSWVSGFENENDIDAILKEVNGEDEEDEDED